MRRNIDDHVSTRRCYTSGIGVNGGGKTNLARSLGVGRIRWSWYIHHHVRACREGPQWIGEKGAGKSDRTAGLGDNWIGMRRYVNHHIGSGRSSA